MLKMWYIYTVVYYSAIKSNEFMHSVASEVPKTEKLLFPAPAGHGGATSLALQVP